MGFLRHEGSAPKVAVQRKEPRSPGAPAPCKPSWSTLEPAAGEMRVPDGRAVKDVTPAEFRRIVSTLDIPGADASMGYIALANAYAAHLAAIGAEAGKKAVAVWLEARRAVG